MNIDAIAFDFGNTLCPWDEEQYWQVTKSTLEHIRNGYSIDHVFKVFSRIRDKARAKNIPRLVENDLAAILGDTLKELTAQPYSKSDLDDLINNHVKAFVNVCNSPDGLNAMLNSLHNKYRLAVVSNYPIPECIRMSLRRIKIDHYFETTIVSGDLGVMKPSCRIFDKALSALSLPPEKVLFVGDDWIADIIGAWTSGMPCVHIKNGSKQKPETNINTFGAYLEKALDLPELSGWQEAKPIAVLNSVLELGKWLEEQAE